MDPRNKLSKLKRILIEITSVTGMPHETMARLLSERYASKERKVLTLVVKEQKLTPAEMRRSCMLPQ